MNKNMFCKIVFPSVNNSSIDCELERKMSIVKKIVSLVHSLRKNNHLKVRQPLAKIMLYSNNEIDYLLDFKEIILNETNVKELKIIDDSSLILNYIVKPNFKILGEKYKEKIKQIATDMKELKNEEIKILNDGSSLLLDCGIKISKEDCIFDANPQQNVCIEKCGDIIIALDTKISRNLEEEGIAREFISLVQNYRKTHNFNPSDKIDIDIYANENLNDAINKYLPTIKNELLCYNFKIHQQGNPDFEKLKISDDDIFMKITKR